MKRERIRSVGPMVAAMWIVGGAMTVGLSEVAQVLSRTGERLYAYEGGWARWIGFGLVLIGAIATVRACTARVPDGEASRAKDTPNRTVTRKESI